MSRFNMHFSPSGSHSPQLSGLRTGFEHEKWNKHAAMERYLIDLLAERQKIGPFTQVLPNCSRLLNQEIMRIESLMGTSSFLDHDQMQHGNLLTSRGILSNGGGGSDLSNWSSFPLEQRVAGQSSSLGLRGIPASPTAPVVKRIIRVDVSADTYPNFNFVGRLLGPRGNYLKRLETGTGCRIYIRGRGSIKDTEQEEKLRDKPGYEHLNEPLHVLIEAELPATIVDAQLKQAKYFVEELLKPVDESHDLIKQQQLRELAMLNGTLRGDESPFSSGNASPFNNSGMKRAKTGQ